MKFLKWLLIKNKKNAFTLIELLVVIAIIGLLASIVLVSLNTARAKARDTKRKADVGQLQIALELYYDTNGQYPSSTGATSPNGGWSNSNDSSWVTLQALLMAYMPTLPHDPKESGSNWPGNGAQSYAFFSHNYGCDQQWYMLVYRLENANDPDNGVQACNGAVFRYGGDGANTNIKTVGARAR